MRRTERSGGAGAGRAAAPRGAARLTGATLVVDGRTDTSSDIVIGDRFQVPSAVARTEQPPTTCKTERV